jgi:hypothetical protein
MPDRFYPVAIAAAEAPPRIKQSSYPEKNGVLYWVSTPFQQRVSSVVKRFLRYCDSSQLSR